MFLSVNNFDFIKLVQEIEITSSKFSDVKTMSNFLSFGELLVCGDQQCTHEIVTALMASLVQIDNIETIDIELKRVLETDHEIMLRFVASFVCSEKAFDELGIQQHLDQLVETARQAMDVQIQEDGRIKIVLSFQFKRVARIATSTRQSARIAIFDTNGFTQLILDKMLTNCFCETVLIKDRETLTHKTPVDGLFVDIREFAEEDLLKIKKLLGGMKIPIIGLSGDLSASEYASELARGFDEIMPRPYKLEWVKSILERFDLLTKVEIRKLFNPHIRDEIEKMIGKDAYIDSLKLLVMELREAMPNFERSAGAMAAVVSLVHKLSGVSAMLGVQGIHDQLLEAEIAAKANNSNGYAKAIRVLSHNWPLFEAELLSYINEDRANPSFKNISGSGGVHI